MIRQLRVVRFFIQWLDRKLNEERIKNDKKMLRPDLLEKLNQDIRTFKDGFRHGNEYDNPYIYKLLRFFGYKDIDRLSLRDLFMIGFHSDYITRYDIDKEN